MSEETRNSLFEEDLSDMMGDISDMVGKEEEVPTAENNDDNENPNPEDVDYGINSNNDGEEEEEVSVNTEEDNEVPNGEDADSSEEDEDIDENEDINDSPSLAPYAKLLVDEGILPNFNIEDYDGSPEALIEAARNEVTNGIQHYKESLPDGVKRLIEGYEAGVPFEKLLQFNSESLKYSDINEESLSEDENLQRQILKDYYKRTSRFSDEKIDRLINQTSDLGELYEEANSSLKELTVLQNEEEQKAIEDAKKHREDLEKQSQKQLETFKNTLKETSEIIPGIKVSDSLKSKIEKNITTPVALDEQGNPLSKVGKYRVENPIDFEIKLNYIFEATNGFKNFDVFGKSGKNKAYKELENVAKSLDKRGNSSKSTQPKADPNVTNSINDFLNNF